jgi:hypothetical protein
VKPKKRNSSSQQKVFPEATADSIVQKIKKEFPDRKFLNMWALRDFQPKADAPLAQNPKQVIINSGPSGI